MGKHTDQDEKDTPLARSPYAKPELIEYGQIEKLTQSGGTTTIDHGVAKKVGH